MVNHSLSQSENGLSPTIRLRAHIQYDLTNPSMVAHSLDTINIFSVVGSHPAIVCSHVDLWDVNTQKGPNEIQRWKNKI